MPSCLLQDFLSLMAGIGETGKVDADGSSVDIYMYLAIEMFMQW